MSDSYIESRRNLKLFGKKEQLKKVYQIPKVSEKKKQEIKESKGDNKIDKFFERNRKKMVGICQCGCAKKSQKSDDTFYRHGICHIFPKAKFPSVATNDYNWVERTFWEGHHTNFDEQGMDKWPAMADWDDIREKFFILAPLLTDEERATKFYQKLEKLVYAK
jgi:hypothetical protein